MKTIKIAFIGCLIAYTASGLSAVYVSEALGVTDSNDQVVTALFGSAGNSAIGPVAVSQSLILGPPNNNKWVSFTLGEEATFGFGNLAATGSVFVAVLSNGGNETGVLYGRAHAADPWVLLGQLSEPLVGPVGGPPNIQPFPLAGTGLPYVNQIKIVSGSSAGTFPGIDVQAIGADSVITVRELGCDQIVTGAIAAGQTDYRSFSANAGDVVAISVGGTSFNGSRSVSTVADIYDATGRLGSCTNGTTHPLIVRSTGPCTVLVHADDYLSSVDTYGLSCSTITAWCGRPLIWGLPATRRTIGVSGETDTYMFRGVSGSSVLVTVGGTSFNGSRSVSTVADIYDWHGKLIGSCTNGTSDLLQLTADTGPYKVLVHADDFLSTETYGLSLLFIGQVPATYNWLAASKTNGTAELNIWGQVGQITTLMYATNLGTSLGSDIHWSPLTNFSLTTSPYRLVDWSSINSDHRFYRTKQ